MSIMNKFLILLSVIFTLQGCDVIQTPLIENNLQSAITEGNLNKQLQYIDELSAIAPEKYRALADKKEKLLPHLFQLMDNPKNISGISDQLLQEIIDFAPNEEVLSYSKHYLVNKRRVNATISSHLDEIKQIKSVLTDKLAATPNHVKTYKTTIQLRQIQPFFLLSDYVKQLVKVHGTKQLNGFEIDAISQNLAKIYKLNQALETALSEYEKIDQSGLPLSSSSYVNENQDITQLILWLYKKQLLVSYQLTTVENQHLLSLLSNQYGRSNLDEIWLSIVEPVAKKLVVASKEGHLNVLNVMSAKLASMSAKQPRLANLYTVNDHIEKLFLSLLWPPNGLANFETTSAGNTQILWQEINKLQPL